MHQKQTYAGFNSRMLAHNVDLVIMLPFFYLIGYFIENNFLLVALCFLLYVVYHSAFEASKLKGTPGKKFQKMKVIQLTSEREVPFYRVVLRNLTKFISALPFFIGFVMIAFDPKGRGLHDRIAGTAVIFE